MVLHHDSVHKWMVMSFKRPIKSQATITENCTERESELPTTDRQHVTRTTDENETGFITKLVPSQHSTATTTARPRTGQWQSDNDIPSVTILRLCFISSKKTERGSVAPNNWVGQAFKRAIGYHLKVHYPRGNSELFKTAFHNKLNRDSVDAGWKHTLLMGWNVVGILFKSLNYKNIRYCTLEMIQLRETHKVEQAHEKRGRNKEPNRGTKKDWNDRTGKLHLNWFCSSEASQDERRWRVTCVCPPGKCGSRY